MYYFKSFELLFFDFAFLLFFPNNLYQIEEIQTACRQITDKKTSPNLQNFVIAALCPK
jgi:hypothetical protein